MNTLMLEGWMPILLLGIFFMVIIIFISRNVTKKTLYSLVFVLNLICMGVVILSIVVIGGWEGMGIGFIAISSLVGIWIGTLIGSMSKTESN